MLPHKTGLYDNDNDNEDDVQPVINLAFSLGADQSDVQTRTPPATSRPSRGRATKRIPTYDIWLAGLSSTIFHQVSRLDEVHIETSSLRCRPQAPFMSMHSG